MLGLDNGVFQSPSRLSVYDRKGQPMSPYTESKSYMVAVQRPTPIEIDLR